MNVDIVWSKVLNSLKEQLTSLSYGTWFVETKLYSLKDGKATIIVPIPIHKKHLSENYSEIITSLLYEYTNSNYELLFLLKEEIEEDEKGNLESELLKSSNNTKTNDEVEDTSYKANSNLNTNYTFENFIVGNSNKFAHAAALSVAENPGKIYNPLFLYGNSGVGKTHLMHAIGNYIHDNSNKRVLYVTSEQFIDEFIKTNRKDESGTNFNYVEFFKNK